MLEWDKHIIQGFQPLNTVVFWYNVAMWLTLQYKNLPVFNSSHSTQEVQPLQTPCRLDEFFKI